MIEKSSIEGQLLISIYRQNFDEFKKGLSKKELLRIGDRLNRERLICKLAQDASGEVFSTGLYPNGRELVEGWKEE